MAFPVFPSTAQKITTIQRRVDYETNKAQFGGGYSQRVTSGENNISNTFNIKWDLLTSDKLSEITVFLDARGGAGAFIWRNPSDNTDYKVVSESLKISYFSDLTSLEVVFRQVFDLDS